MPLAQAPAWLLAWLRSRKGQAKNAEKKSTPKGEPSTPARSGSIFFDQVVTAGPDVQSRAVAYLAACPPAISGQGGHDQTFEVARAIVYGFDLGVEEGFDLLWKHYNPRCQPPWSDPELRHKCEDADTKPFDKPRGYLLQKVVSSANSENAGAASAACAANQGFELIALPVLAVSAGGSAKVKVGPYRPFPLHALPPILSEYAQVAGQTIGCDPALITPPVLAVSAGCIGNARAVQLKPGWIEPCVIWALTVADSGCHKSPAYDAATAALFELQMEEFDRYKEQLEAWDALSFGEQTNTPTPKEPPPFVTTDATIEALAEMLEDRPKGVILARDELAAWFQSFTRYKGKGGGTERPQWLELNKAGQLFVRRKTTERKQLASRRACASLTGTIQPGILKDALDHDALQAGLGARFLMAMPPRHKRVWTDNELPDDLTKRYRSLLRTLLGLELKDQRKRRPHVLELTKDARRLWIDFYNRWGEAQYQTDGAQAAAYAKVEAYAIRLALLHHVVSHVASGRDDRCPIQAASVHAGIELACWFAHEADRVYAMLAESEETLAVRRLVELIRDRGGRISTKGLQHNSRKYRKSEDAEVALEALVQAGLGKWEERPSGPAGGRPTKVFVLALTVDETDETSPGCANGKAAGADETVDETSAPVEILRERAGFVGFVDTNAGSPAVQQDEKSLGGQGGVSSARVEEVF
jgi:hypothetical protein